MVTLWDGRSSGSDTYYDFYVNDGKVEHPFAMEGYRNGIANIARWYKMGLVDQEVFTRGKKSRDYHMQNNIGGVTHDWFASTSSYNDKLKDKFEGFEFKAFAPPASISGVRMEEHRRTPIKHSGWAIGISNQYPVETIKYFDFWFSKEGRRLANFGVEGEHYDLDENDNAIFKDSMLNGDKPVNNMLYDIGAQLLVRGFYQDFNYEKQWSNKHALEGIALYDEGDYLIDQFLGVSLNSNEQEIYNKYWPKILEYMLERQQAWILGNENVVNDWNAYVYTLNELGLQKVLDVMNIAYLRQYAGS